MCQFIPQYMVSEIIKNAPHKVAEHFVFSGIQNRLAQIDNACMSFLNGEQRKGDKTIYDAENRMSVPGKVVRVDGQKQTSDEVVNNAYDFAAHTLSFYKEILNRKSIDNKGFHIHSTVHFGRAYPNAYWDQRGIVFGDGDGEIFRNFVLLDVVGHEISHGLTSHTANLKYYGESGSCNEHYSDVFGMSIKQKILGETNKTSSWIVGENIFNPKINGKGIRSFSAPGSAYDDPKIGKDKQPAHYKDKYTGPEDQNGVHWNSGILNKIFYEYCVNTGKNSFDGPAQIWYDVLTTKLGVNSNFNDMVNATQQSIIQKYGTGIEYKAFKEAANCVGLAPKHPIFSQMGV